MRAIIRKRLRIAPLCSFFLTLTWTLGSAVFAPAVSFARADAPGSAAITAAQMKDYLSYIASDEMEGRNTPSRGLDTTAKFIATLLSRWGVKPGGDDSTYFQKIMLSARHINPEMSSAVLSGQKLTYGQDFVVQSTSAPGSASGQVVFGGEGWMIKADNVDPLRGVDAKGKIVVVSLLGRGRARPDGKAGEDWADPVTNAKSHGALGVVMIPAENTNLGAAQRANARMRYSVDRFAENAPVAETGLPLILLNGPAVKALFAGEKAEAADIYKSMVDGKALDAFEFKPEKQISLTAAVEMLHTPSQNVVGIIEGSDPTLKSEYVGLSAHYDHVGMLDTPVNGDRIFNGADDDGSGTTAVLAVADALSHAPRRPKRSLLLIWHMGEEKGLWGSRYFTMFPTVPLDHVGSLINIDMIGRSRKEGDASPSNRELSGPNSIYVIGATMMSTELDKLCRNVNDKYLKLNYDFKYDDPNDRNRFFFRSDHVNYARQHIPILFYFDGVHEDYHQLGDDVSKIDFDKMERVTRTIYQTLWELANLKHAPTVDKPTPPQLR